MRLTVTRDGQDYNLFQNLEEFEFYPKKSDYSSDTMKIQMRSIVARDGKF